MYKTAVYAVLYVIFGNFYLPAVIQYGGEKMIIRQHQLQASFRR